MNANREVSSLGMRLLAADIRVSAALQRRGDGSRLLRAAAIPLARSADGWPWMLALALAAVLGPATGRMLTLRLAAAVLATGIAVKLVKLATRRERPVGDWGGSYRRSDPHAFPSGHAARAFLLAVIACAFGPPGLGGLALLWATLVATSRVALGVHYLSDVLGGALLGTVCGLLTTSL